MSIRTRRFAPGPLCLALSLAGFATTLLAPSFQVTAGEPASEPGLDGEPTDTPAPAGERTTATRETGALLPDGVRSPIDEGAPPGHADIFGRPIIPNADDRALAEGWLVADPTAFTLEVAATAGFDAGESAWGSDIAGLDGWSVSVAESTALGIRPDPDIGIGRANLFIERIFGCPGAQSAVGLEADTGR